MNIAKIPLSQGKFAIVDIGMVDILSKYRWQMASRDYGSNPAKSNCKIDGYTMQTYMHHVVIGHPLNNLQIDHINGNALDNRLCNLRIVTPRENSQNRAEMREGRKSSKFIGVCWHKASKKWIAKIRINRKNIHLGLFNNEIEASKSYEKAVSELLESEEK